MNKGRWPRGWSRAWLLAVGVVALAGAGLGVALQPATANALGYALAVRDGLPNHFYYLGTHYFNDNLCAGDSSCQPERAMRWSPSDLTQHGIWPLKQVSSIFTVFGPAHSVFEPVNDPSVTDIEGTIPGNTPWMLFVPDGRGAYFMYARPGGP